MVADSTVAMGKTGGASVLSCGAPLTDISWTQVSGPPVNLQAARTPTVSFDTNATGVIRLKADATLADGSIESTTTDITVGAAPVGSFITVRGDHSVRPKVDTSVRAWPTMSTSESVASVTWVQTAGPTVKMTVEDNTLMMFTAPDVAADTALRFRATLTTSAGRQDVDDVLVTVDRQGATPDGYIFESTARVHPYRQASAYAGVLARCSYDVSLFYTNSGSNNFCTSTVLPPLQTEAGPGAVPSVAQVMGRVLVSHDFLGANFEQFLETQDTNGDFRRLLAGVSTIVIGSHVRPSFYTAATGAIYLDANYLWLNAAQRDIVTEVPDYRSSFDDLLNFTTVGRMVKNNDYARRSMPIVLRGARSQDELVFELGRLLYHELAHASDFLQPSARTLNGAQSIWGNISPRVSSLTLPSDKLALLYPLTSAQMKGLGQVMYQGATPNIVQRNYTAADVGGFFGADVATDDYAYSIDGSNNSREDLAMLFEEFMMAYRHGVVYDVGYTNQYTAGMTSAQLILGWGQRGRIAQPSIKPRIRLVLSEIAPWIDLAAVDRLPAPIQLRTGSSWDASLVQAAASSPDSMSKQSARRVVSPEDAAQRLKDDLAKPGLRAHGKLTPGHAH